MSKLLRQVNAPLAFRFTQAGVDHVTTSQTPQRQRRWQHSTATGCARWVRSSNIDNNNNNIDKITYSKSM